MIEASLRCYTLGLLGQIPVLGLGVAWLALTQYQRVRRNCQGEWNPADKYLRQGLLLAGWGIVSSLVLLVVVSLIVMGA